MPETVVWLTDSKGLDNRHDPMRSGQYDKGTGVASMLTAVNVQFDDTGRVCRSPGFTQQVGGSYHSLFHCGSYCLCASNDQLLVLDSSFSTEAIATVTPGAWISYARVGSITYYVNGYEKGKVFERERFDWVAADYVGPPTGRTFSDPPIGHLVAVLSGRICVAQDEVVWYSEPFAHSWFDYARNYIQFGTRTLMLAPVEDGMYVSDSEDTYFLEGLDPMAMRQRKVADYPAIPYTVVEAPGYRLLDGRILSRVQLWWSRNGACLGAPGGKFINLTERKLVHPGARRGAGLYQDGRYLCLLEE